MSGSGSNATFDQTKDILAITEQAKVNMTDEKGQPATDFSAGMAVLDRTLNTLTLDNQAHVLRNQQVIDADHVLTRLSDDEQIVQYIELRNNARVTAAARSTRCRRATSIWTTPTMDRHSNEWR
jgi:lipopolysaccharide export system protein LptA